MAKLSNFIKSIDFFGRAAFIFRFTAYLFYLFFLLSYLHFIGEPINNGHFVIIVLGLITPFAFIIDYCSHQNSNKAIVKHLTFDLLLMGWFIGVFQLNYLPASLFSICTITNYIASKGFKQSFRFLFLPLGYLLYIAVYGFSIQNTLPNYLIALTIVYTFIHLSSLAYISYQFSKSLYRVKNKVLAQKEEIFIQTLQLKEMNSSLKHLNRELEGKVSDRTKELAIKNQKLAEYAFINGHQLRAPVATILGLVQLLDFPLKDLDKGEIINKIKYQVNLLDVTIKDIRLRLESDKLLHKEISDVEINLSRSNRLLNALELSDDGNLPSSQ